MAGIYIHIPYCRKACHYCNFHFSTTRYNIRQMQDSLIQEASLQKDFFKCDSGLVSTIYFGGGTPSILPAAWIAELIECIRRIYPVEAKAEVTLEANPDDINPETLQNWQQAGINRLSIGVQSFIDKDLEWMNRAHNAQQAYQAVAAAKHAGIHDISLDLIYGTPYLSDQGWQENLQKAADLGVHHLSAYALTVEPRTALFKMIEKGKLPPVNGHKQSRQFDLLMRWADLRGFEHYEISNLSAPGCRSRHNSSYWQGLPYLGLGPAAHSFDGLMTRKWNIDNNQLYIQGISKGEDISTTEVLSVDNQINEMVMIRLRLIEGLDLRAFRKQFGELAGDALVQKAQKALNEGQLIIENEQLMLTRKGKHFADSIAVDLFV